MKRISLSRTLCGLLVFTVFCGVAVADIGAQVPQFSTQSLDGQRFSDASLRGRVVLLEFWATWCPHCLSDQAAVNNIARRYSGEGLVVLAVDVGEPENKVRKFLTAHPSACPVALDEDKRFSARFGKHGIPYYVAIDRDGFIAGTQEGAGGEEALISMLSLAGLDQHSNTPRSRTLRSDALQPVVPLLDLPHPDAPPGEPAANSASVPSGPKIIEVPQTAPAPRSTRSRHAPPPKPAQKTIFVLASGERLESDDYTMEAGTLHVKVGEEQRTIPLSALDLNQTLTLNRQRGIDLKIPKSRNEVSVSF